MKKNIHIIMGGPSAEYEVSIHSACEVLSHIDTSAYAVKAVVISRQKEIFFCTIDANHLPSPEELAEPQNISGMQGPFSFADSATLWNDCDVAFLALHGSFGEDGIIQGYLDSIGVAYTGSSVFASAVAMNKIICKYLYQQNGFNVPPYLLSGKRFPANTIERIITRLGLPCFVKCPQSGSSRLMGCATSESELRELLDEYSHYASEILVEQTISGTEFTCGVLEEVPGRPFALPPVEIRPKEQFFTYNAKYTVGVSEEIVPAPQPPEVIEQIQQIALAAHQIIGCSGLSRTDMILFSGKLYVLETNTLPGLTSNSLLPKSYTAMGGNFTGLIDCIIHHTLSRKAAGPTR